MTTIIKNVVVELLSLLLRSIVSISSSPHERIGIALQHNIAMGSGNPTQSSSCMNSTTVPCVYTKYQVTVRQFVHVVYDSYWLLTSTSSPFDDVWCLTVPLLLRRHECIITAIHTSGSTSNNRNSSTIFESSHLPPIHRINDLLAGRQKSSVLAIQLLPNPSLSEPVRYSSKEWGRAILSPKPWVEVSFNFHPEDKASWSLLLSP